MKPVKFEKIEKQYDGWLSYYSENKARGEQAIDFVIAGNQWDSGIVKTRADTNKESLTFNQNVKHLRRAYTQMGEIEFSLNIAPTNEKYSDNVEETNAFRLLLNSILLNDDVLNKCMEAGKKCLNYGMAFAEVNFGYVNYETLDSEPKLIIHKDPSIAFWDKNALHPTKVDGRFAGFCRSLTDKELIEKYPTLKRAGWLKSTDNRVFDYWWREIVDMEFVLLKTGVRKREDLLTFDDKENIVPGVKNTLGKICEIHFQRCCKERILEEPRKFPTMDLPIVYHPGLTDWHPKKGDITMPYCEHMKGAQQLHNYVLSQAASQAKSCTGDKYFFSNEHVSTSTTADNARNINKRDGGFTFKGDISSIRREQPAQISPALLELANQSKQEIDEINGSMIDHQNPQQTVISGKALDKITHNTEAINMWFMEGHITFVSQIGKLYRQMIPELYTQERTIIVKKKDGSGQPVAINQDAGTGKLTNNIKDINSNFHYEITSGPSSTMQKENTIKYLMEVYTINPAMFQATAHIFFRNLQTKDASELERIAMAMGDQNLIKYAQGEISFEDYQQLKEQAMQKQMQMQAEMAKNDPQAQGLIAAAQAETEKAKAMQYDSETRRMAETNKTQTDQLKIAQSARDSIQKTQIEIAKIQSQQNIAEMNASIEMLQKKIDTDQQLLDAIQAQQQMALDKQNQAQPNASTATSDSAVY